MTNDSPLLLNFVTFIPTNDVEAEEMHDAEAGCEIETQSGYDDERANVI